MDNIHEVKYKSARIESKMDLPMTSYFEYTERRRASQVRASKSQEQVVWYGGENAHQDVCICLVPDTINNDVDDGRTLASLMMLHSNRLETCSSYFAAALSERWMFKRNWSPQELTFHGDIRLYADCFSRMYKPFVGGFEGVKYTLQLLAAATHLTYDDLISSICIYLTSVHPWSYEDGTRDEIRIQRSVLWEDFPSGHAQDLLELLEKPLTRDDLHPLIRRCIEQGMKSLRYRGTVVSLSGSSLRSARQAREALEHLLVTAQGQERSPIPMFKQEVVCVINKEFKDLLVAANVEVEAADTMEGNLALIRRVDTIQQILDILLVTGMADEALKCVAQYTSFPKVIEDAVRSELNNLRIILVTDAFICTVLTMVKDVVGGKVHVEDLVRDALLLKWLHLIDWVRRIGCMNPSMHKGYAQVKQALLSIAPSSHEIIYNVLASRKSS